MPGNGDFIGHPSWCTGRIRASPYRAGSRRRRSVFRSIFRPFVSRPTGVAWKSMGSTVPLHWCVYELQKSVAIVVSAFPLPRSLLVSHEEEGRLSRIIFACVGKGRKLLTGSATEGPKAAP